MQSHRIAIVGASGYAGMEATRLLARHPHVELAVLTSSRWAGSTAAERVGLVGAAGRLRYVAPGDWEDRLSELDVALLATPADASASLAPALLEAGVRVIDLSGAHRIRGKAAREEAYGGGAAGTANWVGEAVYGLPELHRDRIPGARLVANPGCYPTAITLALAPLLASGVARPDGIVAHAMSGVSGAGRRSEEVFSFAEIAEDVRAYRVFDHQHVPELRQVLEEAAGAEVPLHFTPHLLPIRRGILATIHGRLQVGMGLEQVRGALASRFAGEPFVEVVEEAAQVSLRHVVGTNRCRIGASVQGDTFVVCAAIDNLIKGAAGQAVQNLNLMLGCDETLSLAELACS